MAPGQGASRALAVLRVGNVLLHVNKIDVIREVVKAIARPDNPAARSGPGVTELELAATAAEVLARAVAVTKVFWCPPLWRKGWWPQKQA